MTGTKFEIQTSLGRDKGKPVCGCFSRENASAINPVTLAVVTPDAGLAEIALLRWPAREPSQDTHMQGLLAGGGERGAESQGSQACVFQKAKQTQIHLVLHCVPFPKPSHLCWLVIYDMRH